MATPKPFRFSVTDSFLSFINQRVSTARIPTGVDLPPSEEWSYGVPPKVIQELQEFWTKKYDWRAVEKRINSSLQMYTLPITEAGEELEIHFVWHKSEREGAIPLLFQHGWPGNFLEVEKIINSLTTPSDPTQQAYHVVAPSLPGFCFSTTPKNPSFNLLNIASVDHKLMQSLGYDTYIAQGGGWGSMVARAMGRQYPQNCVGVHVNMLATWTPSIWRNPLSFLYMLFWVPGQKKKKEKSGVDTPFARMLWWQREESGYSQIQGTKPQTISYALMDSPVGMMAWIRDKLHHLVDDDFVWEPEEVITWAMLYLIPNTSGPANIYKNAQDPKKRATLLEMLSNPISSDVDFGVSVFPKDVFNVPRWWAAATVSSNIVFWRDHDKGGHFASVEKPEELVREIRDFTQAIHPARKTSLVSSGKLKK